MDCPNHIRRTKSSIKKRIIVRRTVRSMFGEQTFAQLRTGFRESWTQHTAPPAHLGSVVDGRCPGRHCAGHTELWLASSQLPSRRRINSCPRRSVSARRPTLKPGVWTAIASLVLPSLSLMGRVMGASCLIFTMRCQTARTLKGCVRAIILSLLGPGLPVREKVMRLVMFSSSGP